MKYEIKPNTPDKDEIQIIAETEHISLDLLVEEYYYGQDEDYLSLLSDNTETVIRFDKGNKILINMGYGTLELNLPSDFVEELEEQLEQQNIAQY